MVKQDTLLKILQRNDHRLIKVIIELLNSSGQFVECYVNLYISYHIYL